MLVRCLVVLLLSSHGMMNSDEHCERTNRDVAILCQQWTAPRLV